MVRFLAVLCFGLTLLRPVRGATSTFYGATPYPLIAPTSTTTFRAASFIPTRPGANDFVISPDGKTAYFLTCGPLYYYCPITAMDLETGKMVHKYHPLHNASGPMALLPDGSELYVATCRDGSYVYVGATALIASQSSQVVAVIDTQTLQVAGNVLSGPPFVIH